jgi:hypothetical protein
MKVGIGNHIYLILLHCWYQKYQKLLQHVNISLMFPLTHLSFKIFPYGTALDVIINDPPIFNRYIVHGITNMSWWKYSIATTNSSKGSIDTTNLPQRIIGQLKGILGFIVNYHPPPNNNNVMLMLNVGSTTKPL